MRSFNIYVEKYDWIVRVYVKVSHIDTEKVLESLAMIGCSGKDISDAMNLLYNGRENNGICYSNPRDRISVMVITKTSSPDELLNSLVHEIAHLGCHIANEMSISLNGEELCYLQGNFAMSVFPYVKDMLCECCRKKIRLTRKSN